MWAVASAVAFQLPCATVAMAADVDCVACHGAVAKAKVVHTALQAGCTTCHGAIDASVIPHKVTGTVPKGLSAEQGELCLGCHDKAKFTKKVVHAALGMGCTSCHNPHGSANEKLLNEMTPDVCFNCHSKADFEGKVEHAPVADGMCTGCHDPHSTDQPGLLQKHASLVCLDCHGDIKKSPHVVAGFRSSGHPLGDEKRSSPVADPLRQGKAFSCVSCHQPHRSDFAKLSRFDPNAGMGMCQKCHPK
jgi:predicted CXXCH cytochrome family protein